MRSERTATVLRHTGLAFAGLFAGFLITVLVLELSLRGFDGSVYTQVRQVELRRLDDLASATLLPALLTTALLAATTFRARGRTFWLTSTAFALLLTVLVTTLAFNLPINADQLDWTAQAPPADWTRVRDRWQIAHAVRTASAVLAFGLLTVAAAGTARTRVPDGATASDPAGPAVLRGAT
ncbi:anthrone oxygenase family protein [Streptomyces sp. NPDC057307]|uniref:anthrone oxygenase family protein n=1 Tax=Streptomyces sp. NPDC057307 TaxID=3346096 RepID=UPI00362A808E